MGVFFTADPPITLPRFADADLVDPISGVNNVVEPTTDYKNNGWYPARVRVFRPFINWLHRWTYRQLAYWYNLYPTLDIALATHRDQILALTNRLNALGTIQYSPYPTGEPMQLVLESTSNVYWDSVWPFSACSINSFDNKCMDFWVTWQRIGRTVILHLPQVMGTTVNMGGGLRSYLRLGAGTFSAWRDWLPGGPSGGPIQYADSHIHIIGCQNIGGSLCEVPAYIDMMGLVTSNEMNIWTQDPAPPTDHNYNGCALGQNSAGVTGFRRSSVIIQLKQVAE
jgi:hypothetical protein